jgi:hypothetical protein
MCVNLNVFIGMKTDGNGRKTPLPFLYPHFIIGNGMGPE